ncbi:MAG TPA: YeeE/YedE family protein [Anaerolineae bacterium]|nr:YeeE/YedE family protein [Anaerolineae bacterium]
MNPLTWTGLAVGIVFGFALQRGRFCMNSAFRDIIVLKDYVLVKAVGIAILVEMIGFEILALTGVITLNPKPLFWGANIVGGLIFGVGMVLAGGCASGITYRFGEGMVGAMSAVVGFSLGGLMTAMGVLKPIAAYLQANTKVVIGDGQSPTLANIFGVPHYVMAFGIAILVIVIWIIAGAKKKSEDEETSSSSLGARIFKHGWGWLATGIVIGVIGIIAFPLSAAAGRNYPLGITGGWIGINKALIIPDTMFSWEALEVLGAVVGAFLAAIIAGEFGIRAPSAKMLLQTFLGGFLMAFGAVTSSGCNIGHILSGIPQLSIGSILGGTCIVLGAWITAYFMFVRPMNA